MRGSNKAPTKEKRLKGKRRWPLWLRVFIAVLLVMVLVVVVPIAGKWCACKDLEWRYSKSWSKRPRPTALRNTPRVLKALPVSASEKETPDDYYDGNRYHIADLIVKALEAYYIHEGCYPPYLFGGDHLTKQERRSLPPSWCSTQAQEIDPLLQGGYLKEYPTCLELETSVWVWRYYTSGYYGYTPDAPHPVEVDQRGVGTWRCMYSTPGDYTQLGLDPASFVEFYKRYPNWKPGRGCPRDYNPTLFKLTQEARREALGGSERLFALGGVANPKPHRYGLVVNYRLFPGNNDGKIRGLFKCTRRNNYYDEPYREIFDTLPFFGYQRGEWFGADKSEAWIWFYGSNLYPNYPFGEDSQDPFEMPPEAKAEELLLEVMAWYPGPPLGLDLLNAQTGELTPDGIPDGICLLCKLSHGKLVEVIDAGI
jgi:hypothetical protein